MTEDEVRDIRLKITTEMLNIFDGVWTPEVESMAAEAVTFVITGQPRQIVDQGFEVEARLARVLGGNC